MTKVVLATSNPGKVAEMQNTLASFGFDVVAQTDLNVPDAVEDGLSFVENALIKARHACRLTGLPAIADDSGIEVDALDGAPGIYSARYADNQGSEANIDQLLSELGDSDQRSARFQCLLVFMQHATDPTPIICHGSWEGRIALQRKGENGFGYDPIFVCNTTGKHAAQLLPQEKKHLSHRAKALLALRTQLTN